MQSIQPHEGANLSLVIDDLNFGQVDQDDVSPLDQIDHSFHERSVVIAAEQWMELKEAYSADLLCEKKPGTTCSVRTAAIGGFLYTAFSMVWGGSSKTVVNAYRLIPLSMYQGEVVTDIVYDDSSLGGGRRRGDHTGLVVKSKGSPMVCALAVTFERGMPSGKPISMKEATAYDEKLRNGGWRHWQFKDVIPAWGSYAGHPVAHYKNLQTSKQLMVILWRSGGSIEELVLSEMLELESASMGDISDELFANEEVFEQISLF